MKILYFDTSSKICNYYSDIVNYLKTYSNLNFINSNIDKEIIKFKPDIIILGFTVTNDKNIKKFNIKTKIPLYIILNKEYERLNEKLNWIKKIKPKKVFTVHHSFKKYEEICQIPFCKIMWSADHNVFKKYNEDYKHDLFFSGVIRKEQTDNLRNKINNKLDLIKNYNILMKVAVFKNDKLIGKLNTFNLSDYANNIQNSKIALTTTGPGDLVGTRYFEIMASNKALILCNIMPIEVYEDILIDKFNCVMFGDENDFIEKFKYYIEHEEERMKIVNQAYKYFLEKHTWDHKVKHLLDNL
jgi:spore maturation protein CgeB